jgi:hypothetical protein
MVANWKRSNLVGILKSGNTKDRSTGRAVTLKKQKHALKEK